MSGKVLEFRPKRDYINHLREGVHVVHMEIDRLIVEKDTERFLEFLNENPHVYRVEGPSPSTVPSVQPPAE